MVNKGYETNGMHFRLTTDVDLNGSEALQWVPIGLGDRYYNEDGCNTGTAGNIRPTFNGHFDGGNHYISNIYIDNSDGKYGNAVGLFGSAKGIVEKAAISKELSVGASLGLEVHRPQP